MSKVSQKEAVVQEVLSQLPSFQKYIDNAILLLSSAQLEAIKNSIVSGISNGTIEYSKDITNTAEVRSYGRSMVMNHLKKAKELNGGHTYVATSSSADSQTDSKAATKTIRQKVKVAPKGVDPDLLTEELKEYVKTLV